MLNGRSAGLAIGNEDLLYPIYPEDVRPPSIPGMFAMTFPHGFLRILYVSWYDM